MMNSDMSTPKKFLIISQFGEIADLIPRLESEGHKVLLHISDGNYQKIYDGMSTKIKEWYRAIGKGFIWVFDGCENGDLQDYLRERGEFAFVGEQDVRVFRERRERSSQLLPLTLNYRSRPEVLAAVNELFGSHFGDEFQPLHAAAEFPDPVLLYSV